MRRRAFEGAKREVECALLFLRRAFHRRRIFDAPVCRHRLAGPHRTDFLGRMVTDRKHEVEVRRTWRREFVPALGPKTLNRQMVLYQSRDSQRMHRTTWVTAAAECMEPPLAVMTQQHLRHNAARRVAGAEKQDVECAFRCHQVDRILTT